MRDFDAGARLVDVRDTVESPSLFKFECRFLLPHQSECELCLSSIAYLTMLMMCSASSSNSSSSTFSVKLLNAVVSFEQCIPTTQLETQASSHNGGGAGTKGGAERGFVKSLTSLIKALEMKIVSTIIL